MPKKVKASEHELIKVEQNRTDKCTKSLMAKAVTDICFIHFFSPESLIFVSSDFIVKEKVFLNVNFQEKCFITKITELLTRK